MKGRLAARAERNNGARGEFFAGSALSAQHHGGVARRHAAQRLVDPLHRLAAADQSAEGAAARDFVAERARFQLTLTAFAGFQQILAQFAEVDGGEEKLIAAGFFGALAGVAQRPSGDDDEQCVGRCLPHGCDAVKDVGLGGEDRIEVDDHDFRRVFLQALQQRSRIRGQADEEGGRQLLSDIRERCFVARGEDQPETFLMACRCCRCLHGIDLDGRLFRDYTEARNGVQAQRRKFP